MAQPTSSVGVGGTRTSTNGTSTTKRTPPPARTRSSNTTSTKKKKKKKNGRAPIPLVKGTTAASLAKNGTASGGGKRKRTRNNSSNSNNNSNNNHSSSSRFKAVESYKNIRLAIGVLFEVALGSPPEHEWKSKKTVQHICNLFGPDYKSKRSFQITVKGVMRSVLKCQDDGIPFTAEGNYSGVGRKKKSITEIESVEAEVVGIADAIENGNSLKTT
mmetsp:Transcript_5247/g.12192  ORF Transcript_5247/g.12192 Transcript_5247/m.12192 type:complete len:216 (-) Transcript_5247:174-821(-)